MHCVSVSSWVRIKLHTQQTNELCYTVAVLYWGGKWAWICNYIYAAHPKLFCTTELLLESYYNIIIRRWYNSILRFIWDSECLVCTNAYLCSTVEPINNGHHWERSIGHYRGGPQNRGFFKCYLNDNGTKVSGCCRGGGVAIKRGSTVCC